MIVCEGLRKRYGPLEIFSDISLQLEKSQITVLRGPSGCGKTTLFKCLAMLESWDDGIITVNEKSISSVESTKESTRANLLRKLGISVVFQQLFLWPHMTCKENIKFVCKEEFDWSIVERFGLDSLMDKKPSEISLGQAQRIAFIRAISSQPKYLFLDEVTSALDHKNVALISDYINKMKSEGLSIFAITHSNEFEEQLNLDIKYEMNEGELTNAL